MYCFNKENFYLFFYDVCKVFFYIIFDCGLFGLFGINIDYEKVIVVLMFFGGVFICFYDGIYINILYDKFVEYGVFISDIYKKMEFENLKFCNEIFIICN